MAISGFDRTSIYEIGINAQSLIAQQNLFQEILKDLINKSVLDLNLANKKSNERQQEMNNLYFFMNEFVALLELRSERLAKEFAHEIVLEDFQRLETEFFIEQERLQELTQAYEQYQVAEANARLQLLKELETSYPKLKEELNKLRVMLTDQIDKINKTIVKYENRINELDVNIRANLQNIIEDTSRNYRVNNLQINNDMLEFTEAELTQATKGQFDRDLNKKAWDTNEDLARMENVFINLGMTKLASRGLEHNEQALERMFQWAKVEARGYVSVMRHHAEHSNLVQLAEDRKNTVSKLDKANIQVQSLENSVVQVDNSLVLLANTVADIQNPNGEVSSEEAKQIFDAVNEIKEEVENVAEINQQILNEDVSIDKSDNAVRDIDNLDDDFDMDAPDDDYSPPSGNPSEDGPQPDEFPPPYNPDDLGPPNDPPPPNEPDPGNTPPPDYYNGSGMPEPSAPSAEIMNNFDLPEAPPEELLYGAINQAQARHELPSNAEEKKPEPSAPPQEFEDNARNNLEQGQNNIPSASQPNNRVSASDVQNESKDPEPLSKQSGSKRDTTFLLKSLYKNKEAATAAINNSNSPISNESKSKSSKQSNVEHRQESKNIEPNAPDESKNRGPRR